MQLSPSHAEIALAGEIHGHCSFTKVELRQCSAKSNEGEGLIQPFTMSVKEARASSAEVKDGHLLVTADFTIYSEDSSKEPQPVFSLECQYRLVYALDDGFIPQQPQIDAFASGNALYNCWPYLREFVQNIAARMGQFPPPLPLLRVRLQDKSSDSGGRQDGEKTNSR